MSTVPRMIAGTNAAARAGIVREKFHLRLRGYTRRRTSAWMLPSRKARTSASFRGWRVGLKSVSEVQPREQANSRSSGPGAAGPFRRSTPCRPARTVSRAGSMRRGRRALGQASRCNGAPEMEPLLPVPFDAVLLSFGGYRLKTGPKQNFASVLVRLVIMDWCRKGSIEEIKQPLDKHVQAGNSDLRKVVNNLPTRYRQKRSVTLSVEH